MPIQFQCDRCGQRLSIGSKMAGRRVHCMKCQHPLTVPADAGQADPDEAPHESSENASADSVEDPRPLAPPPAPDWFFERPEPSKAESANGPRFRQPPPVSDNGREQPPSDATPDRLDSVARKLAELAQRVDRPSEPTPPSRVVIVPEETGEPFDDMEDFPPPDPALVAVSRRALYLASASVLLVGVVSFVLGALFGSQRSVGGAASLTPQPCRIQGRISVARGSEAPDADRGAVVLLLPQDERPPREDRIAMDHLGPNKPAAPTNDPAIQAIRQLGGDYARANSQGAFQLRAPDRGRYYLLVISANQTRDARDEIDRSHLAEMRDYFLEVVLMVENQRYQWRPLRVSDDRRIDIVF